MPQKGRLELIERGRKREHPVDVRVGHGSQATERGAKTGEPAQAGALKSAQQLQEKRTVEISTVLFLCRDLRDRFPERQKIRKGRGLTMKKR